MLRETTHQQNTRRFREKNEWPEDGCGSTSCHPCRAHAAEEERKRKLASRKRKTEEKQTREKALKRQRQERSPAKQAEREVKEREMQEKAVWRRQEADRELNGLLTRKTSLIRHHDSRKLRIARQTKQQQKRCQICRKGDERATEYAKTVLYQMFAERNADICGWPEVDMLRLQEPL